MLCFGAGVVEFIEPDCRVSGDNYGSCVSLDDDELGTRGVAWRRNEPDAWQQFKFTVNGNIGHTGRIDPFRDGVVILVACVVEFLPLDVDGLACEEMVASAVVEVKMGVYDDVDSVDVEVLLVQWVYTGVHVGDRRMELSHAGVDQNSCIWVVNDVHVDRHRLALGEQIGDVKGTHGDLSSSTTCSLDSRSRPVSSAGDCQLT